MESAASARSPVWGGLTPGNPRVQEAGRGGSRGGGRLVARRLKSTKHTQGARRGVPDCLKRRGRDERSSQDEGWGAGAPHAVWVGLRYSEQALPRRATTAALLLGAQYEWGRRLRETYERAPVTLGGQHVEIP